MARPSRQRTRDPFTQSETFVPATVLSQTVTELFYDYEQLPTEQRESIRRAARTIKPLLKRTAEDIFIIGGELRAVRDAIPHGRYTDWLAVEFGLSERMAQHFVNVRERLGPKSEKFSVLPPSTLYMLAAPSTPDEAISSVEKRLDAGDRLSVALVQRTIKEFKSRSYPRRDEIIDITLDGEITGRSSASTPRRPSRDRLDRLHHRLTEAIDLLSGEVSQTWADFFHNSDLSRLRNELDELRRQFIRRLAEDQADKQAEDDTRDLPM